MKGKGVYSIDREETYHDGQLIFKEEDSGDCIYMVLSGSVETSKKIQGRKYFIERLQPGELFGETELIGGLKRTITAKAIGETTIGVIDQNSVKEEYEQLSNQFKSILESIPLRLKKILDRAFDVSG